MCDMRICTCFVSEICYTCQQPNNMIACFGYGTPEPHCTPLTPSFAHDAYGGPLCFVNTVIFFTRSLLESKEWARTPFFLFLASAAACFFHCSPWATRARFFSALFSLSHANGEVRKSRLDVIMGCDRRMSGKKAQLMPACTKLASSAGLRCVLVPW